MTITKEGVFVSDQKRTPFDDDERFPSTGHLVLDYLAREELKDLVILVDAASGREWTRLQLRDKILSVATGLIDHFNFKRGTCVAIHYDHSDYEVILALGVVAAGGVVACAYPKDPYAELLDLAKKTEPKILFCNASKLGWARQLSNDMGYEALGVPMDEDESNNVNFQKLLYHDYEKSPSRNLVPVACEDKGKELSFVAMTSGTTGPPKVIPVTHKMVIMDLFNCVEYTPGNKQETIMFHTSLDYISARVTLNSSIRSAYKAIIPAKTDLRGLADAIEKYKINILFLGVSSFYNFITDAEIHNYDLSSLTRTWAMGGKITYLKECADFFARHPNIKIAQQLYGASEHPGTTNHLMSPDEYVAGGANNSGKLTRNYQAKILDRESRRILGINETGLIAVKGPAVFPGYYDLKIGGDSPTPFKRDPSKFDEDGFYITDDLVYFNEQEKLHVVGRRSEFMRCEGQRTMSPDAIEEVINTHPAVLKVCVVGIPNKKRIDCPRAFIVPKPCCYESESELPRTAQSLAGELLEYKGESELCSLPVERRHKLAADIMDFMNERAALDKRLTGGIILLDDIPTMKGTGKMNKTYLKSLKWDQVEIYGDRSGV